MSEPPLREKVLSWLKEQGYPLEMRVASLFRQHSHLDTRQSWHYIDLETTTSREIDVVVTGSEPYGYFAVHFAVECKASTKPWVLFTSKHTTANFNRLSAFAIASRDARAVLGSAFTELDGSASTLKKLPWFWEHDAVGYALAQAFDGKSDTPYAATLSAVKAAWSCAVNSPQHNQAPRFTLCFPIVVTTSPLFNCQLGEDGGVNLVEIDSGFLFFQQRIHGLTPTRIAIVSAAGLTAYVGQCAVVFDELKTIFEPAVAKAYEEFQASLSRGA